jgi:hypothetical protein
MKAMKLIWGVLIIVSLCVGAGCSSTQTYSQQLSGKNLSANKTYAWLPTNDTTAPHNGLIYQNIRRAADRSMRKKGYRLDIQNPDMLLRTNVIVEHKQVFVRSRALDDSYYYYYPEASAGQWKEAYFSSYNVSRIPGYGIAPVNYAEGAVIIDVIEPNTNNLIWRGWSQEEVDSNKEVNKLYENVGKIFKDFPASGKK